jgi:hypothetical protein
LLIDDGRLAMVDWRLQLVAAKAGMQSVESAFPRIFGMDSRSRGNDHSLSLILLIGNRKSAMKHC